jgi:hypothetical protein
MTTLNRGFARQRETDRTAVQAANDAAKQMLSYGGSARGDQVRLVRDDDCLGAAPSTELAQDASDMGLDGLDAHVQTLAESRRR